MLGSTISAQTKPMMACIWRSLPPARTGRWRAGGGWAAAGREGEFHPSAQHRSRLPPCSLEAIECASTERCHASKAIDAASSPSVRRAAWRRTCAMHARCFRRLSKQAPAGSSGDAVPPGAVEAAHSPGRWPACCAGNASQSSVHPCAHMLHRAHWCAAWGNGRRCSRGRAVGEG